MIPILLIMAIGIGIGSVAPYTAPKYTHIRQVAQQPTPAPSAPILATVGSEMASWYGVVEYCEKYNPKCIMANGEKLDDTQFTAACDDRWKIGNAAKGIRGDMVAVSHNEKTVIVECTDRGNFAKYGRVLDLSKAAFSALAPLSRGGN